MFKISEFSKLSQVPAKTLRFYDQIELLKPAYTDQQSGYRYYKSEQLLDLHRILAFKELGFTLEQIKQLLKDNVSTVEMRGMLRLKQAELHSLIQSKMERLRRIEVRLEQIERQSDGLSQYEVVVKKVEPLLVATLKETTSRASIPGLFEEIDEYLKWDNIPLPVTHMVMRHGCPECESNIDLEIACPIPRKLQDTARFRTVELPGLTVAAVTHISRPDVDTPVSIDLGSWIEENGYQISPEMPSREVYLSTKEGDKLRYVTESQMPILGVGCM